MTTTGSNSSNAAMGAPVPLPHDGRGAPSAAVLSNAAHHPVRLSPDASERARAFFALCTGLQQRVEAFLRLKEPTCAGVDAAALQRAQAHTRRSLDTIGQALGRYSTTDELALSYNGGKDCLVLLILYLAALPAHFASSARAPPAPNASSAQDPAILSTTASPPSPPPPPPSDGTLPSTPPSTDPAGVPPGFPASIAAVYIEAPHPFVEVDAFVAASARTYHLELTRHEGSQGLKAAFASYLALHPHVRAIFVGTRRTDPHGASLAAFHVTDRGWPAFMRVHPVLDWGYADIWTFLRTLQIPYCELYDHGYTSLGGRLDTNPNPALRAPDGTGAYRPAHELLGDEAERWGRDSA